MLGICEQRDAISYFGSISEGSDPENIIYVPSLRMGISESGRVMLNYWAGKTAKAWEARSNHYSACVAQKNVFTFTDEMKANEIWERVDGETKTNIKVPYDVISKIITLAEKGNSEVLIAELVKPLFRK